MGKHKAGQFVCFVIQDKTCAISQELLSRIKNMHKWDLVNLLKLLLPTSLHYQCGSASTVQRLVKMKITPLHFNFFKSFVMICKAYTCQKRDMEGMQRV